MEQTKKDAKGSWGVFLTRGQPFHRGHMDVIETALLENESVLAIIGSADKSGNERNPYDIETRELLFNQLCHHLPEDSQERVHHICLRDLSKDADIPHATYSVSEASNNTRYETVNGEWGLYLYYNIVAAIGRKDFTLYFNDDPEIIKQWFPDWIAARIRVRNLGRSDISASAVREAIRKGDSEYLKSALPYLDGEAIDIYQKKVNNEEKLGKKVPPMEKKNIDWGNIGFGYIPTDYRYVSYFKDGAWDDGALITDPNIVLNECAGVLQYAQTVFEGLKAYTTEDGHIVTFRPDLNADRLMDSAARLEIPVFPKERFIDAVTKVIAANAAYVPPYGSGATLYVRPYIFGSNAVIGVKPADEYQFRILTTPVGPYFKGGAKPITIRVSDFDRAAPHGTGHIKAGLNYAMSLHAIVSAHKEGYDENLYLDPATRTKVEETGGANFLFVTKDNKVVTPKSSSILPSITRRSLVYVAKEYLGLEVEEREVYLDEVKDFAECGLCGTAAVISPVGKIVDHGKEICFASGMEEMGPTTKKLYETLTGIQMGRIEAPKGWIHVIE